MPFVLHNGLTHYPLTENWLGPFVGRKHAEDCVNESTLKEKKKRKRSVSLEELMYPGSIACPVYQFLVRGGLLRCCRRANSKWGSTVTVTQSLSG